MAASNMKSANDANPSRNSTGPKGLGITRFGLERKPEAGPKVEYFYVIKENKYGKRQRRRVMVERSSSSVRTGQSARLRLLDERGLCKRNFLIDEIEKIITAVTMEDDSDGEIDDDARSSGGASRMSISRGSRKPTVKLNFVEERGGRTNLVQQERYSLARPTRHESFAVAASPLGSMSSFRRARILPTNLTVELPT